MKVTVFTSNQPRHLALLDRITRVADEVFAVIECNTVFPGQVQDFFSKSDTMQRYFSRVMDAERHYFGGPSFLPESVSSIPIKSGDLNHLTRDTLAPALNSDVYVVFGSSFIQGWLVDFLVNHRAINIHMGLSPYYRGSSCNFWALLDGNPAMVGSTIHLLTRGLDSGPILRHAIPILLDEDPFHFTMKAVVAAFIALTETIRSSDWNSQPAAIVQDKSLQLRYTRNSDFTDSVAAEFLSRGISTHDLQEMCLTSERPTLLNPLYF